MGSGVDKKNRTWAQAWDAIGGLEAHEAPIESPDGFRGKWHVTRLALLKILDQTEDTSFLNRLDYRTTCRKDQASDMSRLWQICKNPYVVSAHNLQIRQP